MNGRDATPAEARAIDASVFRALRYRIPELDGSWQQALAEANDRAFRYACIELEAKFPGLPVGANTQNVDSATFVAGHSAPGLVGEVGGREFLDFLLSRLRFESPAQIRLVRDRQPGDNQSIIDLEPSAYAGGHRRLRLPALASALDSGFTAVFDGLDWRHPNSIRLAELFERAFGCAVNINGYLSYKDQPSFGAHWDDQETVILQIMGSKRWRVEQPVDLSPLKSSHGDATSGDAVWEGVVRPGDALYIPRGWGHLVNGLDELSFHYTITISRPNGVTLLEGALSLLEKDRRVGVQGSTISPDAGEIAAADLVLEPVEIRQAMRQAQAVLRFAMLRRGLSSLQQLIELERVGPFGEVRMASPSGWLVSDPLDDEVALGACNGAIRLPLHQVDDLASISDGKPYDATEVEPALLRALIGSGIFELVSCGPEGGENSSRASCVR